MMPELFLEQRTLDTVADQVMNVYVQLGEIPRERACVISGYSGDRQFRGIMDLKHRDHLAANLTYAFIKEEGKRYRITFEAVNPENSDNIRKALSEIFQ